MLAPRVEVSGEVNCGCVMAVPTPSILVSVRAPNARRTREALNVRRDRRGATTPSSRGTTRGSLSAAANRRKATRAMPERFVTRTATDLIRDRNRDRRAARQARRADRRLRDRHCTARRITEIDVVEVDRADGRRWQHRLLVRVQRCAEVEVLPRSDRSLISHGMLRDLVRGDGHDRYRARCRRARFGLIAFPSGMKTCTATGIADQVDMRHPRCP